MLPEAAHPLAPSTGNAGTFAGSAQVSAFAQKTWNARQACPISFSVRPLPTPAPPTPSPTTPYEAKDQQEHDCAYEGIHDQRDYAYTEVNAQSRQQPITDESADEADYQIPDQPKATPFHHSACQPPGNDSDDNDD
jgi:hypothetical protein